MSVGTDKEQLLFAAALPIADPGERETFLQTDCADAAGLRSRVAGMLAEHNQSEHFFSECIASLDVAAAAK